MKNGYQKEAPMRTYSVRLNLACKYDDRCLTRFGNPTHGLSKTWKIEAEGDSTMTPETAAIWEARTLAREQGHRVLSIWSVR